MVKTESLLRYDWVTLFTWALVLSVFGMVVYLVYREDTDSDGDAVYLDLQGVSAGISDDLIQNLVDAIVGSQRAQNDAEMEILKASNSAQPSNLSMA